MNPTPMQVISDEQDTLVIVLRVTLGSGNGVGRTDHVEPFQFSAIGVPMPFFMTNPTALHPMLNCVVLHDTLENSLRLPRERGRSAGSSSSRSSVRPAARPCWTR